MASPEIDKDENNRINLNLNSQTGGRNPLHLANNTNAKQNNLTNPNT